MQKARVVAVIGLASLLMVPVVTCAGGDSEARIDRFYAGVRIGFAEVPDIGAEEALSWLGRDDVVFVDVREPAERAVSMIPGALAAESVMADPAAFKGRRLVAYCTVGARSGEWAKARQSEGMEVVNLAGSLLAWTHAGGPLTDPEGRPTRRVHVWSRRFAWVADGYEAVW